MKHVACATSAARAARARHVARVPHVRRASSVSVAAARFRGAPAVVLANPCIEVTVVTAGGHIASLVDASGSTPGVNPLWEPDWPYSDPALRNVPDDAHFGDGSSGALGAGDRGQVLEAKLLKSIMGHNLCADVFGAHSDGEVARSGLTFHGEAGQVPWTVTSVHQAGGDAGATVTLQADLRASALRFERKFTLQPDACTVSVVESVTNLLGVERPFGRAQHVTLGEAFLGNSACMFNTNADKGATWPEDLSDASPQRWRPDTQFDYPHVPRSGAAKAAATPAPDDWRRYPRTTDPHLDLCTLRIQPDDTVGWFVADQRATAGVGVALVYAWEREAFPWLMTWEENRSRQHKPWNGRTLTRGLEFSSYAFALGRRWNVTQGTLLDTPTYQWLDAHETRSTTFWMGVFGPGSGTTSAGDGVVTPTTLHLATRTSLATDTDDGTGHSYVRAHKLPVLVSDDESIVVPLE